MRYHAHKTHANLLMKRALSEDVASVLSDLGAWVHVGSPAAGCACLNVSLSACQVNTLTAWRQFVDGHCVTIGKWDCSFATGFLLLVTQTFQGGWLGGKGPGKEWARGVGKWGWGNWGGEMGVGKWGSSRGGVYVYVKGPSLLCPPPSSVLLLMLPVGQHRRQLRI